MLKPLQWTAALSAIVLLISLAAISYYSSPPPSHPSEQQSASETKDEAQTKEQHSLRGFIRFMLPDAISIFTFWLVIATAGLGIIAIVQLGFLESSDRIAAKSAKAAEDAAEIANKSLIATNRAWVSVTVSIDGDLTWADDGTARLPVRFDLKNLGKVPADISIPVISAVHLMFGPVDPIKRHEELCAEPKFPFRGPFGVTLFPDGTATEKNEEMIRLDEVDFFKKREGDKQFTPVVMGCIKYRFSLDDKTHTTPFIFVLGRTDTNQPGKTLGIVPDGSMVPKANLTLTVIFASGVAD